jgi:hypothetical protein
MVPEPLMVAVVVAEEALAMVMPGLLDVHEEKAKPDAGVAFIETVAPELNQPLPGVTVPCPPGVATKVTKNWSW